ncbi:replication protein A 70 kDa DNA-binding subunit B-like [Vicia villosa]|uniref:replication protein A 70 kDa DNA-binding subunit B-like n=1 Tax=Vicia villosa TaxID=3911 RepID=UPI00273BF4C0|nr:replication protein A 70 kDa DNA-binding subunit B-like [Vicia villosa]
MARPMEKVVDINDSKELWKVAVRVVHKWKVVSNNKEHYEMIFQDKEGSDIHVVVPNTCMAAYNDKFEVDNTYTVSNFAVPPNNLVFKPSTHKFLVKFTGGTSVNDVNKHDIPPMQRAFTSFPDIMIGKFKKDVLIDVIGVIDAIGYQQTQSGGETMQVNFVLRDATNNTMNCTLWEDYAKQFFKFHEKNPTTSGPTVILLSYAKVKEQGQYPLSVTNTFHVTKLQINPDLPSVKDFVNGFSKEDLRTVSSQLNSHSQQYSRSSNSENGRQSDTQKLLNMVVTLPLSQLKQLREDTFCATVAKTRKLIASSYGWYYRCCHACTKAARGDKTPYECDNHHLTGTEIYKECQQILGISAAQMRDTMIHAGITDPLDFPLKLDAMLDLDLALRVRWQPSWDSCSVIRFIDDKLFVKQFGAPWEPR